MSFDKKHEIQRLRFIKLERENKRRLRLYAGRRFIVRCWLAGLLVALASKIDPRIQIDDIRPGMDERTRECAMASIASTLAGMA
jgi:hypothetical protein